LLPLWTVSWHSCATLTKHSRFNVLYGAAKAGWMMQASQVQQLLAAFERLLPGATPQNIANSWSAVATMGQAPTEQQTQQLLAALLDMLPTSTPQAVANSLWAFA
jgi:hypothetical protein